MKKSAAVFGVLLLMLSGCSKKKADTAAAVGVHPSCGSGREAGELRFFSPDTLFNYNDGGAELYLEHGFRSLVVRDCRGPGAALAVAELFDMGNAENARYMFNQDRGNLPADLKLGEEAFQAGDAVFVRQGQYLIRVLTIAAGADPPRNALDIAAATVSILPR